jgi:hypothetical protein
MIRSSDLLIFLEKTNFSNRFSIRYFINSSHHLNFYHCIASSIYLSTYLYEWRWWCFWDLFYVILEWARNCLCFFVFLYETRQQTLHTLRSTIYTYFCTNQRRSQTKQKSKTRCLAAIARTENFCRMSESSVRHAKNTIDQQISCF